MRILQITIYTTCYFGSQDPPIPSPDPPRNLPGSSQDPPRTSHDLARVPQDYARIMLILQITCPIYTTCYFGSQDPPRRPQTLVVVVFVFRILSWAPTCAGCSGQLLNLCSFSSGGSEIVWSRRRVYYLNTLPDPLNTLPDPLNTLPGPRQSSPKLRWDSANSSNNLSYLYDRLFRLSA